MHRLLLACLAAIAPVSLAADTYPRQTGVDAVHYVFRISLDDLSNEIAGETTVTVKFLEEGIRDVALDLTSAVDGKGMTVSSASLPYTHTTNVLRLTLRSPSTTGQEASFTIHYKGVPAEALRRHAPVVNGE